MALFSNELDSIIECDPIARKHFIGVFPANKLPSTHKRPAGYIINLDDSHLPGSHWVAVWVPKHGAAIYFDSYGMPPLHPLIMEFMDRWRSWTFNTKVYQANRSKDCGYYALLFIMLCSRNKSLSDIQYLFYDKNPKLNDKLVDQYVEYLHSGGNI